LLRPTGTGIPNRACTSGRQSAPRDFTGIPNLKATRCPTCSFSTKLWRATARVCNRCPAGSEKGSEPSLVSPEEAGRGVDNIKNCPLFTPFHICSRSSTGNFLLVRHTMSKRFRAKLGEIKTELQARRHQPLIAQGTWLGTVLRGNYRYYGVPSNINALGRFRIEVTRLWFRSLRRQSQKRRLRWDRMTLHVEDGCQPHESVILGLGIGSTLVLKIGAECSNPARSDLCGGPGETSVPTATVAISETHPRHSRHQAFTLFKVRHSN
jgi:hypothetical protein